MKRSLPISIGVVTICVIALLGALLVILYNGLISSREQVNAGWAQVENVYQRRLDLVPLLIDAVQTYTDHERETLAELTEARARALDVGGAIGSWGTGDDRTDQGNRGLTGCGGIRIGALICSGGELS